LAVSIQQAGINAFAAYLQSKLPDCKVENRWPAPDRKLVSKTITVIPAGSRKDDYLEPRILSKVNQGDSQTRVIYQVASCYQPMQLDVWCTGHLERDDLISRLDTFLRAGASSLTGAFSPDPVGAGCLIAVQDGWQESETTADFIFEDPDTDDEPSAVEASQFRATYRGGAYFKLTIPAIVSRQKVIKLSLLLDGLEPRETTSTS
jgi:hypothetical protein